MLSARHRDPVQSEELDLLDLPALASFFLLVALAPLALSEAFDADFSLGVSFASLFFSLGSSPLAGSGLAPELE